MTKTYFYGSPHCRKSFKVLETMNCRVVGYLKSFVITIIYITKEIFFKIFKCLYFDWEDLVVGNLPNNRESVLNNKICMRYQMDI